MSQIIKNTIKYASGVAFILAFGVLILAPEGAEAKDKAGYYKGYSEDYANTSYSYSGPVSTAYNPTPGTLTGSYGSVMGTSTTTKTIAKAPVQTDYKEVKEEFSNVTANALFGADSFFPTSIVGWLLFAIFVLIIVVLARKFMGLEKKYHDAPLKHS